MLGTVNCSFVGPLFSILLFLFYYTEAYKCLEEINKSIHIRINVEAIQVNIVKHRRVTTDRKEGGEFEIEERITTEQRLNSYNL